MAIRRLMMMGLDNYVRRTIDIFKSGINSLYPIYEADTCLQLSLDSLHSKNLLSSATLLVTPNAYNDGILHTIKGNNIINVSNLCAPSEGTAMFSTSTNISSASLFSDNNPFGATSSIKLISNATNGVHVVSTPTFVVLNGMTYSYSIYMKKGTLATAPDIMQMYGVNSTPTTYVNFNINTGVVTSISNCTASITSATNSWWRCSMTFNSTSLTTSGRIGIAFCNNNPTATLTPSYADVTTSDTLVWAAQSELDSTPSVYNSIPVSINTAKGYYEAIRTTTAYQVNSTGGVEEVPRYNLVNYSQDFSLWTLLNSPTIIENNIDITSPLGKYTTINDSNIAATSVIRGTVPSYLDSTTVSFRAIVRKDSSNAIFNRITLGSTNDNGVTWNSVTGAFVSGLSSSNVTSYNTNYWEITGTGMQTGAFISIMPNVNSLTTGAAGNAGVGTMSLVYISLVSGLTPSSSYYPTLARTNTPRIDYEDGCPSILMEVSLNNSIVRSEEFSTPSWIKSNVIISASNSILAPNGLLAADTITATADDGYIRQNSTNFVSLNKIGSIYLRRKTGTGNIYLDSGPTIATFSNVSSSTWNRYNIQGSIISGTFTVTGGVYSVTTVSNHGLLTGDGFRFQVVSILTGSGAVSANFSAGATVSSPNTISFISGTATATGTTNIIPNYFKMRFQTAGDEVYAWGAQLENYPATGTYFQPTSYIPTGTSIVTRSNDSLQIDKLYTNNILRDNFTLLLEAKKIGGGSSESILQLVNSLTNYNAFTGVRLLGQPISIQRIDNGTGTTIVASTVYQPNNNTYFKYLLVSNSGTFSVWMDGSLLSSFTMSTASIQSLNSLYSNVNGGLLKIKQLVGWNRVLNSTEIESIFAYPYYNSGYTTTNVELQKIINRAKWEGYTIPSSTILSYCDSLITSMKSDGIWVLGDVFLNFGYNDTTLENWSRINWLNPYGGLGIVTINGTMNYQTNGYKGDGTSGYIDTRFNPALGFFNYTLNNAGRMVVVSVDATVNTMHYDGITNATRNNILRNTTQQHRINCGVSQLALSFNMVGVGLKSIMRDSSTVVRVQNLSATASTTQTSSALDSANQLILRSGSAYADACVSLYYMGASLTNTQISNFRTYYNTFLTNVGLTAFA